MFEDYYQYRFDIENIEIGASRLRIQMPIHNKKIGENTVKVQGVKLFNTYVKNIDFDLSISTKTFKNRIKKIFLPYTIE